MTLLTTNSAFAQTSIFGKWRITQLDAKPVAGVQLTPEQVKVATGYKKAMLNRVTSLIWEFEDGTYSIFEAGNSQEPVEIGTYTFEGENEFLMIRKYLSSIQEETQHRARVKGNLLIIESVANASKESGIGKLIFTLDR